MKRTITNLGFIFLMFSFLVGVSSFESLAQTCSPAPVGLVSWYAAA